MVGLHRERDSVPNATGTDMATEVASVPVLVDAVDTITRRWDLAPKAAANALTELAAELGVDIFDLAALVSAAEHQRRLHPRALQPAPQDLPAASWPGQPEGMTIRESEIVVLIVSGLSNEEIAERLYLSINSVKTYVRTAYRKMGVKSRTRALLWGIDHGFRANRDGQSAAQALSSVPDPRVKLPA